MGREETPREEIKNTREKITPSIRRALLFRNL
jgi:hypothetical protein